MRDAETHLEDDQLLLAAAEPDDAETFVLRRHVEACPRCRERTSVLLGLASELDASLRSPVDVAPANHAQSRAALSVAMQHLAAPRRPAWPARVSDALAPGVRWASALAALALFALGIAGSRSAAPPHAAVAEAEALPVPSITPGAVRRVSVDALCEAPPPVPPIPAEMRRRVLSDYAMLNLPSDEYELDYLITPELGGATDARNLWPQRYGDRRWNARVKDELEDLLPRLVCSHQLPLAAAQRDMADDWIAAYKKDFGTSGPRPSTAGAPSHRLLPARPTVRLVGWSD